MARQCLIIPGHAAPVRDDVRGYLAEQFADSDAVPAVDETGDVKKGS